MCECVQCKGGNIRREHVVNRVFVEKKTTDLKIEGVIITFWIYIVVWWFALPHVLKTLPCVMKVEIKASLCVQWHMIPCPDAAKSNPLITIPVVWTFNDLYQRYLRHPTQILYCSVLRHIFVVLNMWIWLQYLQTITSYPQIVFYEIWGREVTVSHQYGVQDLANLVFNIQGYS